MIVPTTRAPAPRGVRLALVVGLLLVAASGCSEEARVETPPEPAGATRLTVTGTDATGATSIWRLTCDPPGGDHPDPAAACAALDAQGEQAMPPVAKDRVCTQSYGGPEVATVQGTWRGKDVLATFSRTDGCQTARWEALAALLPPAGT